ncbi:MAG TPA: 3-oxoacyl-ACP reductase FabG [Candidatus Merdicola faecigallinarum]|uniref:3-oxoacyl-ACP reductase FabG n=1 Tax=Candidatus Merdicola faecigallinarum TaxID=2840862 RepID=A0A9D1SAB1_9FIRM|nr:3-oxoacyl-ACP reductase FabG [Candidatus Merdicola faecigallinarum]
MEKKVVIVTGASKGIGREIAKRLSLKGYQVVANYHTSKEDAESLKKELEEQGIGIDFLKADLSCRDDAKKLVQFALNKYKKVDILINNAGISEYGLFTDITDEKWNQIINVNLYSAFVMSQEVVQNMIARKEGCIINISSIWGMVGASLEVLYSISKAGMDGLTKALAKELGPSGIRVNSVAPGIIETQMNSHLTEEEKKAIVEEIPLEKIGKPEDIAKCVEWLIEDKYTTGQIISINGGWVIN